MTIQNIGSYFLTISSNDRNDNLAPESSAHWAKEASAQTNFGFVQDFGPKTSSYKDNCIPTRKVCTLIPPRTSQMFLDFAHVFFVVTFVVVWVLIGQFTLIKLPSSEEFRPKSKPINGISDPH